MDRGTFFSSFFFLLTFENDLNLFWVYHFGKLFKKKSQENGRQFHFLPRAPEAHGTPLQHKHGRATMHTKVTYLP